MKAATPEGSQKVEKGSGKGQEASKPRGNLPKVPEFDGDKKKDPLCFQKWMRRADTYVSIAKKIINEEEIGLRLYEALQGEAFDHFDGVPAETFNVKNGWLVLTKVLQKKYDEKPIVKVGKVMDEF